MAQSLELFLEHGPLGGAEIPAGCVPAYALKDDYTEGSTVTCNFNNVVPERAPAATPGLVRAPTGSGRRQRGAVPFA